MSGLVARLPISMVSLGIVLLVSSRAPAPTRWPARSRRRTSIANAAFAVLQGRLIDRLGQGRVLPVAVVGLRASGMVADDGRRRAGLAGRRGRTLCAALAGAAMPQIGSCVRARWSHLVAGPGATLQTAFAFEAVVDEAVFIVGPALVTVLATAVHPLAGLAAAVVAALVGTARPGRPAAHRAAGRPGRPPARRRADAVAGARRR